MLCALCIIIRHSPLELFSSVTFCACRRCCRMYIISPPRLMMIKGITWSAMLVHMMFRINSVCVCVLYTFF